MEASGELDFTSSSFNPLKALYTDGLQPPVPNVQIFNNINEYSQCLKLGKPLPKRGHHGANVQGSGESASLAQRLKNIANNKVRSRNRDPSRLAHLMKVKSKTDGIEEKVAMLEKTKQRPRPKNVLERMELDQHREGPLRILYNCIEKKMQLKVWTRRLKGLRGVCVGYLIAYDKHLNLAMMDVDEMFAIEEEVELDPMTLLNRVEKKKEKKRSWRRKKRKYLKSKEEMNNELNQESITKTQGDTDSPCGEILDIVQSRIDEPREQHSICSTEQKFEFNLSTPIPANSSNATIKGEFDSHGLKNQTDASQLDVTKDENKEINSNEGSSMSKVQKLFTAKILGDNSNPNNNRVPTNKRMGLELGDPQFISESLGIVVDKEDLQGLSGGSLDHSDINEAVIKDHHNSPNQENILRLNQGTYCPSTDVDDGMESDCESTDEEEWLKIWEGCDSVEGTTGDIEMKEGTLWDHGSSSGSSDDEEILLRIWQEGRHNDKGGVTTHDTQMKEEVKEDLRQEQTVCNSETGGSKSSDEQGSLRTLEEDLCDKTEMMMMQDIPMGEVVKDESKQERNLSSDESSSDNDEEVMLQIWQGLSEGEVTTYNIQKKEDELKQEEALSERKNSSTSSSDQEEEERSRMLEEYLLEDQVVTQDNQKEEKVEEYDLKQEGTLSVCKGSSNSSNNDEEEMLQTESNKVKDEEEEHLVSSVGTGVHVSLCEDGERINEKNDKNVKLLLKMEQLESLETSKGKKEDEKNEEEVEEEEEHEKEENEKREGEKEEDVKEEDRKKEDVKEEDRKMEDEKQEDGKEEDRKKEDEKEDVKEEDRKMEDEKQEDEKEEDEKEENRKKEDEKEEGELISSGEETREKEEIIISEEVRCQTVTKGNRLQRNRNSEKYSKEKAKEKKEESIRLGRSRENSERKGKDRDETPSKQRDLKKKSQETMSGAGTTRNEDRHEKSSRTAGENTRKERHGRQHSSSRLKIRSMNEGIGERNAREYDGKTEGKRDEARPRSKTGEKVTRSGSSGQGSSAKKIDKRDLSLKGEKIYSPSTGKACQRPLKGLPENSKSVKRHSASSDRGHKTHDTPTSSANKDKRTSNSISSTTERDKANDKSRREVRTENERKPKNESCGKKGDLNRRSAPDGKKEKNEGKDEDKEMKVLVKTSSSLEKVDKAEKNAVHTNTSRKEKSELGNGNEKNLTRRGERENGNDATSELASAKKDLTMKPSGEAAETSGLEKDLTSKKEKERRPTSQKDRPLVTSTRSRDGDKKSTDKKKEVSERNKKANENETKSVKEKGSSSRRSSDSNTKHKPKEKSKIRKQMDAKKETNEKNKGEEREKESSKEKENTRKHSRDTDTKKQLPTEKSSVRKSKDEKKEMNENNKGEKEKDKKSIKEKENTSKSSRVSSKTEQLPSEMPKIRKCTEATKEAAYEKDKDSKEKQKKSMKEKVRSSTKLSSDRATAKHPSETSNVRKLTDGKQKTNKDSNEGNRKENKSIVKKDKVKEKRDDRRDKGVKNLDIKTNPLVLREISGKRNRPRDSHATAVRPSKIRKVGKVSEKEQKAKVKTKEAKLPGKVVTVRILKVERDKALVLKKRHVNQLFIRGDNVIMIGYENSNSVKNKV